MKIISGGQTGVDRAALDVALEHHIDCGGWCPEGRPDEFGRIPERYPVQELPGADFAQRTLRNVMDSDGTVIIYSGELAGGTEHTLRCCLEQKRPHLLINAAIMTIKQAGVALHQFVQNHNVQTLNLAGPRQSEWSGGYDYVVAVLENFCKSRTA